MAGLKIIEMRSARIITGTKTASIFIVVALLAVFLTVAEGKADQQTGKHI